MSDSCLNAWRSLSCRGAAFFFLLLSGLSGCAGKDRRAALSEPDASQLSEAVLTPFSFSGVSGGAEICFNALDDNGNRLIDEGCGVPQGQVQVSLAWQTPAVDIDLYVSDPSGEIAVHESATRSGLTSTPDCPVSDTDCHAQNFESVYLEEADALPGKYQVRVRLEKKPTELASLQASLSVRTPRETMAYRLEFFREGQEARLAFEVVGTKKLPEKKK